MTKPTRLIMASWVGTLLLSTSAIAACPAATVADMQGVAAGKFPQQYEVSELQSLANCTMEFAENPAIGELNGQIRGNPDLPALADRMPSEPLVVVPYDAVGNYGGTLDALSNA
ncbi:MAG: ABC transporter substrate-binding protein, partial [Paracoccaceae bacterium]|nr:ABC transporter substrate-binding protein [Paracoccaceae bacterium]